MNTEKKSQKNKYLESLQHFTKKITKSEIREKYLSQVVVVNFLDKNKI